MVRLALDPWTARGWLRPHNEHAREHLSATLHTASCPTAENPPRVSEQRLTNQSHRTTVHEHGHSAQWLQALTCGGRNSHVDPGHSKSRLNSRSRGAGNSSDSAKADASFIISLHTEEIPDSHGIQNGLFAVHVGDRKSTGRLEKITEPDQWC